MGSIPSQVIDRAPYRVGVSKCDKNTLVKTFVYNGEFTCTRGTEFFVNGEINFGHEAFLRDLHGQLRADGTYRTRFGYCIEHSGKIYENSNHNVSIAMRRLTRAREADLGYHKKLKCNQLLFMAQHSHIIDELRGLYAGIMTGFSGAVSEAEEHHDDPHAKKALRLQAWEDLITTGELSGDTWLRYVTYKMKKDEWAKPGKEPRMIGDLKVPASLMGFRVSHFLKKAMNARPFDYLGGTIYFCAKPSHAELKYIFECLLNPPGRFFFVYFSDDSCISIRTKNGILRGDVDISSCDGSHGPAVFDALTELVEGPAHTVLRGLVKQCEAPLRVYDLADRANYVELRPHGPRLYSGSTLTTIINNLANVMIAVSIAEQSITCKADIQAASELAGYIVTVDVAEEFEDLTFLKHSPCLDIHGEWQPVLNVGVLLRMSGVSKGSLPGRGELAPRAVAFQRALLQGAYPRTSFPLIDKMKDSVAGEDSRLDSVMKKAIAPQFEYKVVGETLERHSFTSQDIFRRYRLDATEIEELTVLVGSMTVGQYYAGPAAEKILFRDYGLKCAYV